MTASPPDGALVRERVVVAEARQRQPVGDPCSTSSRWRSSHVIAPIVPGRVEEPDRCTAASGRRAGRAARWIETASPERLSSHERRMADVGGDQELTLRTSRARRLAVGQRAGCQRGVDAHLVLTRRERVEHSLAQAEPPRRLVVRRAVRDQLGLVGQGEQVRPQLVERYSSTDRDAVADDVQVAVARSRPHACRTDRRSTPHGCSTRVGPPSRAPECRSVPRGRRSARPGRGSAASRARRPR